jgi:hypothetical protein
LCEYCSGSADRILGDIWLCNRHEHELEREAGGLALLLELLPQVRRALADAVLPRVVREDVREPTDIFEP